MPFSLRFVRISVLEHHNIRDQRKLLQFCAKGESPISNINAQILGSAYDIELSLTVDPPLSFAEALL